MWELGASIDFFSFCDIITITDLLFKKNPALLEKFGSEGSIDPDKR